MNKSQARYIQLALATMEETKVSLPSLRFQWGYGTETYWHITRVSNSLGLPPKRVMEIAAKTMSLSLLGVEPDEPANV